MGLLNERVRAKAKGRRARAVSRIDIAGHFNDSDG